MWQEVEFLDNHSGLYLNYKMRPARYLRPADNHGDALTYMVVPEDKIFGDTFKHSDVLVRSVVKARQKTVRFSEPEDTVEPDACLSEENTDIKVVNKNWKPVVTWTTMNITQRKI